MYTLLCITDTKENMMSELNKEQLIKELEKDLALFSVYDLRVLAYMFARTKPVDSYGKNRRELVKMVIENLFYFKEKQHIETDHKIRFIGNAAELSKRFRRIENLMKLPHDISEKILNYDPVVHYIPVEVDAFSDKIFGFVESIKMTLDGYSDNRIIMIIAEALERVADEKQSGGKPRINVDALIQKILPDVRAIKLALDGQNDNLTIMAVANALSDIKLCG